MADACLFAGEDPQLGSAFRTHGFAERPVQQPDPETLWSASPLTSCRPFSGSVRSSATTSEPRLRSRFCSRRLQECSPELSTGKLL